MSAAPHPIVVLSGEHRRIEAVLAALETFASAVRAGRRHDELADFVRFCTGFIDECHHGKEEQILFAALFDERAFSGADREPAVAVLRQTYPIGVLLAEHEKCRSDLADLSHLASKRKLTPPDRERLHAVAVDYAAAIREHIVKEDGVLFPMVNARLDALVVYELGAQFERFSKARIAADRELMDLGRTLVQLGRVQ